MSDSKEQAKAWLQGLVGKHLPANVRRFKVQVYHAEASINALGLQTDLHPAEGRLVEIGEDWVAIKTARTEFFVCKKSLMESVPELGATVRVTPYARRQFDGTRLDTPKEEDYGGHKMMILKIGERISPIPLDKQTLKSTHLKAMIQQVEELPAPDGVRTIAQMLIDSGASSEPVYFEDPLDADCIEPPPTLEFRVTSEKWNGYLQVIYERAMDYYRVQLTEPSKAEVVTEIKDVDFTSLGEVIANLVDDDRWRIAKVEVLKPGPRKVAQAA